jgi:hypothetical protein
MKPLLTITLIILLAACNDSAEKQDMQPKPAPVSPDLQNTDTESQENSAQAVAIDLCRCLTEPGNSAWSNENADACREAISAELGVENWEKVNFSKNPELNRKWDELAQKCTGSNKVKTGIEDIDANNELIPEIGTSYGYIWESVNQEAQLYTTLAFDGLVFRTAAYAMNGQTDSGNFTKILDMNGKWTAIDALNAEGTYSQSASSISWQFNEDYTQLTNNKGVVFERIKVK